MAASFHTFCDTLFSKTARTRRFLKKVRRKRCGEPARGQFTTAPPPPSSARTVIRRLKTPGKICDFPLRSKPIRQNRLLLVIFDFSLWKSEKSKITRRSRFFKDRQISRRFTGTYTAKFWKIAFLRFFRILPGKSEICPPRRRDCSSFYIKVQKLEQSLWWKSQIFRKFLKNHIFVIFQKFPENLRFPYQSGVTVFPKPERS